MNIEPSPVTDTNLAYTNSDIAGFDVGVAMSPGAVGGTDTVVKVKHSALADGLTVGASMGNINPSDPNNDADELTLSASYAVAGVTLGYTHTSIDQALANSSDIDAVHVGASFAVNDDLTISVDRSTADNAKQAIDEETTSYQVSYTMGSMTVKAHVTKADNVGYSSTATDENKAIAVSFSF